MEAASEGEKKKPAPEGGEPRSKRQMKTALQLEILEKTYAAESYPSEATRAELSTQLGLSDRQLQMWFCHRRLKDRKTPQAKRQHKDSPSLGGLTANGNEIVAVEAANEHVPGSGLRSSPFSHGGESRRLVLRPGVAVPRIAGVVKRYHEPPRLPSPPPLQLAAELRAVAFVEAQLGEPLKEDGPILGMEFDPLPPGAFGAPIATSLHHTQSGQAFGAKIYDHPDTKLIKGSGRILREYQFLPEQPSVRADQYERVSSSHHYGSLIENSNARSSVTSAGHLLLHGDEKIPSGYGFPTQASNLNLLSQQGRQGYLLSSGECDNVPQKNSFTNTPMDANFGTHPITALENPFVSSDRRVIHDEDVSRMERKRKSEEARLAREIEAHEKRIKKELQKQDILRRKREEQIRKEMEKHDRERRKEEEKLLRERQREEERYLREQKREKERKEKVLQKESIRAEKMKQKEELRRAREAAKLKAANERALARRIAKESMELIDDERLELMELAASSKGLPSIVSLDFETLQNLDALRDKLSVFPPKSVQLKRPLPIQPWNDSEENVGNLLMVWRFLIVFADVLGLWPFTLDEFVQAFHDYDPRLLGEVHIALLRSIIKDIEDVTRTPSTGLGGNQNGAANPGGGHPQIVEGAYAWGFDICSWQCHLNALTWPEILRQFSLSAGFGPQLKKRTIEQVYIRDDNEGNDAADVVSTLRNGVAAEKAVAKMHERGFSNPRRSRHCLTPGTVKFAAFHILSLEGNKGLTILEVADKIQNSGLRDLTTSKTPEASIAAALSRDTKLFERTAPSTYCVRTPYRKDPADAEAILSAARERIRIFKNEVTEEEDGDVDDAERDEDSDSDVADDPEVDDTGTDLDPKKEAYQEVENDNAKTPLGHVRGSIAVIEAPREEDADIDESNPGEPWVQGLMEGEYSDLCVEERLNALVALIGVAIEGNSIRLTLEERLEAANALKKQMWAEVQLDKRRQKEDYVMKTHYSAYVGNKSENLLTISLGEARQSPAATADKINELALVPVVQHERLYDPQNDQNYGNNMPSEGNLQMQDTAVGLDNSATQQPGYAAEKSRSQLKSYIGYRAEEMYVYRSLPLGQDRRRNRYWQFTTSASQHDPGCGRIFVELHDDHWRVIDSEQDFDALLASLDVRGVRESHLLSVLQKIESSFKEAVRRNVVLPTTQRQSEATVKTEPNEMSSGSTCHLSSDSPCSTLCGSDSDLTETSTTFKIGLGRNETERNDALKRYQDFEQWIWRECFYSSKLCAAKYGKKRSKQLLDLCDYCHDIYYFEDTQCPSCHRACGTLKSEFKFSEHVGDERWKLSVDSVMQGSISSPLRIRLLKAHLALVEVSVPSEALQDIWTESYRKCWGLKLLSSTSAEELLHILALLEVAIKRDNLSSNFETTRDLLCSSKWSAIAASDHTFSESVPVLPWVPKTMAAVALRLMDFDCSISFILNQKTESPKEKGARNFIKLPSKYTVVKNTQDKETSRTPHTDYLQDANWVERGIGISKSGRRKGGRRRGCGHASNGGRSQGKVKPGKRTTNTDRGALVLGWKGRQPGKGTRKRSRRTTRSKQKPAKKLVIISKSDNTMENMHGKSSGEIASDDWNTNETTRLHVEGTENASSSGRSDYNNENDQATGDEYDDLMEDDYTARFNSRSEDLMQGRDYIVDGDGDDEDEDEDEDGGGDERDDGENDEQEGDLDVEEYINEDSDEEVLGNGDEQNGDANSFHYESMRLTSTSSEYSD